MKDRKPEDEAVFERNKRRLMEKTTHLLGGRRSGPICFLFSKEELKEATNNYDSKQVFLDDGNFRLYKGFLQGQQVIVKKFTVKNGLESSVLDIIISKQMNGHNALKLVGVCLDTEIPVLVFESFKSSGTLGDRMGNRTPGFEPLPWKHRVNIAFHLACSIAYFRLQLPRLVVHGGLKPSSILLDEHNVPKNIDVYSIGLLILALLTGKEVCDSPPIEKSSKAYYLVDHVKECVMSERLKEIMLDPIVVVGRPLTTEKAKELRDFTLLALECTRDQLLERPRISDVLNRLGDIELAALNNKHC
ncbi:putative wall-associated receptor kinase-like 16 [Populus trichocarpa]|uniref:putative wall-associated receptor kinase-like 16 n=1 Tax=Populus trichocarpa TaxID=3694 RepID=UPI0001D45DA3|nr:putative wall-associated receptor kinase-like 16 [Populus trichocarpa]|eukprot:XP_006375792.2 putative wall-associated receptor kinase-like 16 [Populus trichocarpa]